MGLSKSARESERGQFVGSNWIWWVVGVLAIIVLLWIIFQHVATK
jgi:type VI protein secretion system component VasK